MYLYVHTYIEEYTLYVRKIYKINIFSKSLPTKGKREDVRRILIMFFIFFIKKKKKTLWSSYGSDIQLVSKVKYIQ